MITEELQKISLDEIQPWEHNPRKVANEAQEEIESDLRANGFTGVMSVARHPERDWYIPVKGGNTTIELLKKIYQEYKDQGKFYPSGKILCTVVDCPQHKELLSSHLLENQNRGSMVFRDVATTVTSILDLNDKDEVSNKEASSFLKSIGHTYSQEQIGLFRFYKRHIKGIFVESQDYRNEGAGINRDDCIAVRKLYTCCLDKWVELVKDKPTSKKQSTFNTLFENALVESDSLFEKWSVEQLSLAVVTAMSEHTNIDSVELLEGIFADGSVVISKSKAQPGNSESPQESVEQNSVQAAMRFLHTLGENPEGLIVDQSSRFGFKVNAENEESLGLQFLTICAEEDGVIENNKVIKLMKGLKKPKTRKAIIDLLDTLEFAS